MTFFNNQKPFRSDPFQQFEYYEKFIQNIRGNRWCESSMEYVKAIVSKMEVHSIIVG
jgi:hypothetical protein